MAQAQRVEAEGDSNAPARPVKAFRQGGVEVAVWRNHTDNGDMYNATIRNSYKDASSGEWKETSSFSPADIAVLAQLSAQAFQEIVQQKSQSRTR